MLFDRQLKGVERAMDGLSLRFQAASQNVANIHTPGYQREVVNFEDTLRAAIDAGDMPLNPDNPLDGPIPSETTALESWQAGITRIDNRAQRVDGNGVTLESEMADVSRTAMKYNELTTYVGSQYRTLKFVIDAK